MEVISKNLRTVCSVQSQQVTQYFIFLQRIPVRVLVSSIFNHNHHHQPIEFTGEERGTDPGQPAGQRRLEIVKLFLFF